MTYRAMEVVARGRLALSHRERPEPEAGEALIAVEACGICGADQGDIEGGMQGRVPGHEVVGRILALGAGVSGIWQVGQRVGIGRFGGHCETCPMCRSGKFHLCRQQPVTGSSRDGGYAEMMTARHTGLVAIPDELSSEHAAPILCAGIATFNGLKRSGAQAGDTVAILGVGGLGHMAIQYAKRMGFRTVAIGRGDGTRDLAFGLGAHIYIDVEHESASDVLLSHRGARAILSTIKDVATIQSVLPGLAPEGRMVLLGVGKDQLAVSTGFLVGGERAVMGSITGSPFENERALDFSLLTGARPMIETLPLERAQEAFDRMKSGAVTFRMVLTMAARSWCGSGNSGKR